MDDIGNGLKPFAGSNLTEGYLEFSALAELDEMVDGILVPMTGSGEFETSGA